MAREKGGNRFELRVTDIKDPLPDATFGSIGRYVKVAYPGKLDGPLIPQRLTLGFNEKQAKHVDLWTLMLFRVDLESRAFAPVESSRVNVGKREVTAWVNQPGTYGLIGLPKHKAILETLRLLDRFGPQLLEERERGEHGLHDRVCGLILCADPTLWGDGPPGPGNLCTKCLGLDISFDRLPERYLLERHVNIPRVLEVVEEEEPAVAPSLLAWGDNRFGELGDGSKVKRNTPVWVVPKLTTKKVRGEFDWTIALGTDGTVWSWGHPSGFIGNSSLADSLIPVRVGLLTDIVDIAAGNNHALAVSSDGSVWRWGSPHTTTASTPDRLPVRVVGLSDIVAVAAGDTFSLALRNDGRVFAWGRNFDGQLGDGSGVFRASPVEVPNLTAVRSIAAGRASSFAIRSDGSVMAWGMGGNLGDGTNVTRLSPVPIPGLSNIEQVSADNGGLARTTAGEVWYWGINNWGESGDGTRGVVHLSPVRVPGLQSITDIAVGGAHNLALQGNGTVWAWGYGYDGEIGIEPPVEFQLTPIAVPLPGGRPAAGVGAGHRSSFAIVS